MLKEFLFLVFVLDTGLKLIVNVTLKLIPNISKLGKTMVIHNTFCS